MLGADDLLPILVFVLVQAEASHIPAFIDILSRVLDQSSKGAYYSITVFSALQFIIRQLDLSDAKTSDEPEPEPELTEGQAHGAGGGGSGAGAEAQQLGLGSGGAPLSLVEIAEDGVLADVQSGVCEVHGLRRCVVKGNTLYLERPGSKGTGADGAPFVELGGGSIVLSYTAERSFMLQVGHAVCLRGRALYGSLWGFVGWFLITVVLQHGTGKLSLFTVSDGSHFQPLLR